MDSLITARRGRSQRGIRSGRWTGSPCATILPALALRGIAMAQLGDLVRAKALLKRAARAFGPKEPMARARCVVAEARSRWSRATWAGLRRRSTPRERRSRSTATG